MRGMKLPRIRLRTLFAIIALAAIPCSWAVSQRNLIGRRHDFIADELAERNRRFSEPLSWNVASYDCQAPGWLWLFGEQGSKNIVVLGDSYFGHYTKRDCERIRLAKQLFPEAKLMTIHRFSVEAIFAHYSSEYVDDRVEEALKLQPAE
jgi:hypothetical protein